MTYRINGERVSQEEFRRRSKERVAAGLVTPIQAGDTMTIKAGAYDSFVSPVNGEYITSKHQLKEHEKVNDVVQVGDAFDSQFNAMKDKQTTE